MLNRFINRALWLLAPPALGILFAIVTNAGLAEDGVIIGHPITRIVHVYTNEVMASEVQVAIPRETKLALAHTLPIRDARTK
jgi:hypothetical protein